jgi:large subunit ribosomal protein L29
MKFAELKDMTVDELRKKEKSARTELFDTTMKHSLGQVSNPLEIRHLRRDIARVKTALSAKLR